jgi:hypothetical protein
LIKGAWEHLKDLISIRYTDIEHVEFVSKSKGNYLNEFIKIYDITSYIKEYIPDEELKFKWIK